MYRCCIFDLDGTLVNSVYAIERSVNLTLAAYGLGPIGPEETKLYAGDGYKKLLERSLLACGDRELSYYEDAVSRYQEIFKGCCLYRVEPYEGIVGLLDFLREHGIRAAVLSNKPHERVLDNVRGVFGEGRFDLVYGERESEGIRKKPAPDGVLEILRELGLSREECLYLGDTNTDMETGKNCGVDTVGVTWGFRSREELAAFAPRLLADTPSQVETLIKEVNGFA